MRRLMAVGVVALWLASVVGVVVMAQPAVAIVPTPQTYTVDSTADSPPATPGSTTCAASNESCTLRAAIDAANHDPGSTIMVPAGTYTLTIAPTGGDDDTTGDLNIAADVTITGAGAGTTTVDATGMGDRVFNLASGATAAISGLTIKGGGLSSTSTGAGDGGGILSNGTLQLTDSTVTSNRAGNFGGGIDQAGDSSASAILTRVTVSNNSAVVAGGVGQGSVSGGQSFDNQVLSAANVSIVDSTVSDNSASEYGAGVDEAGGATVTITGSTIENNTAQPFLARGAQAAPRVGLSAGTAAGVAEDGGGTVTITGSTVQSNSAAEDGGGITQDSGGTLNVTDTTVLGNTAGEFGGGVFLDNSSSAGQVIGTANFTRVQITGNTVTNTFGSGAAGRGGGLDEDGGQTVTMTDSTINNNTAASAGGGVELSNFSSQVSITGTTISGNTATGADNGISVDGMGGGLLNDGNVVLTMLNDTVTGNSAHAKGGGVIVTNPPAALARPAARTVAQPRGVTQTGRLQHVTVDNNTGAAQVENDTNTLFQISGSILAGPQTPVCAGTLTSAGYNLISDGSCAFTQTGDVQSTDPQLGPLQNNGGSTLTQLPANSSPAVDAIPTSVCPPPSTDQRGITRPQGPSCDKGATEQAFVAAPTRSNLGYRTTATDGGIFDFGLAAIFRGSLPGLHVIPNAPIVGMANVSNAPGYIMVGADGGVYALGGATYAGSLAGRALPAPIVGAAVTPTGNGYLLIGRDGSVYPFGDAPKLTRPASMPTSAVAVGVAITPTGKGAWLATADGGVFSVGDATFWGSAGNIRLNSPIVAITATTDGMGYWLAGRDGGVFAFGDAPFKGSMGGVSLNAPVVGIAATPLSKGYWEVAADGGVFAFGDAAFAGSMGGKHLNGPMVGIAAA